MSPCDANVDMGYLMSVDDVIAGNLIDLWLLGLETYWKTFPIDLGDNYY